MTNLSLGTYGLVVAVLHITLIVTYMPHCGYSDQEVEAVYMRLDQLVVEAKADKGPVIVCGDWNSEAAA